MRYTKGNYSLTPNIEALKGQTPSFLAVYFWICQHADIEGVCFPSRSTIAIEACVSIDTVDKQIKSLEEQGFLTKEVRKKGLGNISNIYYINLIPVKGGSRTTHPTQPIQSARGSRTTPTLTIPIVTISTNYSASAHSNLEEEIEEEDVSYTPVGNDGEELVPRGFSRKVKKAAAPRPRDKVAAVFLLFKGVNPAYGSWFKNITQRDSAERLLDIRTLEEIESTLASYERLKHDKFCPQIDSPHSLLNKLSKFETYANRNRGDERKPGYDKYYKI